MEFHDFVIEASDAKREYDAGTRGWTRSFKVRVLDSDAGSMAPDAAVLSRCDDRALSGLLRELEQRTLERDAFFALGRQLGLLLLPPAVGQNARSVRELFASALDKAGPDDGLRVRLRLPPDLSALPWEYAYLDRIGADDDSMLGFIALDPRVAFVRDESLPVPPTAPAIDGDLRILAALASPPDRETLDLDAETRVLHEALKCNAGAAIDVLSDATIDTVAGRLAGNSVFHFAGHGVFEQQPGKTPGTLAGKGWIAFDDQTVDADGFAVQLRGAGVRLAVLSACETGRRAAASAWGGVASALVRAEVPAIVANQYSIFDKCAIAFSTKFYLALAGGLSLEQAVQAGRLGAYNADPLGRDWGVPVLYLRAKSGELFAGASNPRTRADARSAAEADVAVRVREVAAGGVLTGARVRDFISGKLKVNLTVDGVVYGDATGLRVGTVREGDVAVDVKADVVGPGGVLVGADIGAYGGELRRRERAARRPAGAPRPAAYESTRVEPEPERSAASPPPPPSPPAASTTTTVRVGSVTGGEVIGAKHMRDHYQIGTVVIHQDGDEERDRDLIEEQLRLDVAVPKNAHVSEPFEVVVQVKQPESPVLAVDGLDHVASAAGSIWREEESQVVRYRIEVEGVGFDVRPSHVVLMLRPKRDSNAVTFQVVPIRAGRRPLYVRAYQEDGALAAETRLVVDVIVAVQPA